MIGPRSVNILNLDTDLLQANTNTLLNGTFNWIYQDSYYFDMGQINTAVNNMIQLLLQMSPIDFGSIAHPGSVLYDAGTIV